MKRIMFVFVGLACLAASVAGAEEVAKPFTPRAGIWEFELDGPAFPLGQINFFVPSPTGIATFGLNTQPQRGFNFSSHTQGGVGTTTSVGLTGSLGYCASDLFEVGAALGFTDTSLASGLGSSGSSVGFLAFNLEPFFKFNFGANIGGDARVNPFVLLGAGLNYVATTGSGSTNSTFLIPELALGVEVMATRWWGFSFYLPITVNFNLTSGAADDKVIGFGLAYGVVAHFN